MNRIDDEIKFDDIDKKNYYIVIQFHRKFSLHKN